MFLRKTSIAVALSILLTSAALVLPTTASTSPSLPGTTSYSSKGLNEMLRVTGRLFASLDGLGTSSGSGNIQVEKPSVGAKVVGAYLTVGQWGGNLNAAPTNLTLNSQTVNFTHNAPGAIAGKNYLADVTSLLKTSIDAAGAGIIDVAVDEGSSNTKIEGTSLLVIFDDPESAWGSIIFMFGSSVTAGDSFEVAFPALQSNELSGHWLSLGIVYGNQPNNVTQRSTITATTSSVVSPVTISQVAGGADDGVVAGGALITVGGIGDSVVSNPGTSLAFVTAQRTDDELYGLEDYLSAGDTSINFKTLNPSNDDDIFQAVIFLSRVEIQGAVTVDDPQVTTVLGAPVKLAAALTPTFATPTKTSDGYTVQVSNYDANFSWNVSASVGSAAIGGSGLITLTGLSAGASSTVTVQTTRSGYTAGSNTVASSALEAALTPTFASPTKTSDGFTVQVSNYDANFNWNVSASVGAAAISGTGLITVTGLSAGASSTVTVQTTRTGYTAGSATVASSALGAATSGGTAGEQSPQAPAYSGPIIDAAKTATAGSEVTFTGRRLHLVFRAYAGEFQLQIIQATSSSLTVFIPASLSATVYDFTVYSNNGKLTFNRGLNVNSAAETKSMWTKVSSFGLSEAAKAKIAAFNSNLGDGYTKIRCIVNSANGDDMNEALVAQVCTFANSNDAADAIAVLETRDSFAGSGYWINIWVSGN